MITSTLSETKKYMLAETAKNNCVTRPEAADKVCNLDYLLHISRGNKKTIDRIVAVFFIETKTEIIELDKAIKKRNFTAIGRIVHRIKSAFLILGITSLEPVFKEMELLSFNASSIDNIELLNCRVKLVFNKAKEEMMFEN